MSTPIEAMIEAAHAGGEQVMKHFGTVLKITEKSMAADVRTQADMDSNAAIIEHLEAAFPDFTIHSEETGIIDKTGAPESFTVDPLDGSNNFVLGYPNFTTSIGFSEAGIALAGVVFSPITNQTFHAIRGQGAFLNGKPIHVNQEANMDRTSATYICDYANSREYREKIQKEFRDRNVKRLLDNWSPAFDLCMLAAGNIEAVVASGIEYYDFAAGKLIVQEAGGKVTDFQGQPEADYANRQFIATNGTSLHDVILEFV